MADNSQPSFNILSQDIGSIPLPPSPVTNEECEEILADLEDEESSGDEDDPNGEWLPLDEDLLSAALNGGVDRSKNVNGWAQRRFDEWRVAFKHGTAIPIQKLPLRQLNEMLTRFIMQVKKKDDRLYPPGTLNSLFRGIGRIVRREQERIISETGIEPNHPFDILKDPIFAQSRSYKDVLAGEITKHQYIGDCSRNPLAEVPVNVAATKASTLLRAADHCDKENLCVVLTEQEFEAQNSASKIISQRLVATDSHVVVTNDKNGQLTKSGLTFEGDDDDFDDSFYDELSKNFPDSARAIGRYSGPIINNRGSFTNCTFNYGIDPKDLAVVIALAMNINKIV